MRGYRALFLAWLGVLASTTLQGATFFVTNTNDTGPGSFRQTVLDATTNTGQDTVACSNVTCAIYLYDPPVEFSDGLTILGPGAHKLKLQRFKATVRGTCSITGLKLECAYTIDFGATITNFGK